MKIFKAKYRIVRKSNDFYYGQVKRWYYFGIWVDIDSGRSDLEQAQALINRYIGRIEVVWESSPKKSKENGKINL